METKTTELATVVYRSDVIQKEKWRARKNPERREKRKWLRPMGGPRRRRSVGKRIMAAMAIRHAATVTAGERVSRIIMAAKDIQMSPTDSEITVSSLEG